MIKPTPIHDPCSSQSESELLRGYGVSERKADVYNIPVCTNWRCDKAPLVRMRAGDEMQTANGFLIAKIDGMFCPVCAGGYG